MLYGDVEIKMTVKVTIAFLFLYSCEIAYDKYQNQETIEKLDFK